jgi:hypothetical protein
MKLTEAGNSSASPAESKRWRCGVLIVLWGFLIVVQSLLMPLLCHSAWAKLRVVAILDAFLLLRIIFAWLTKETGNGWRWYACFIVAAPVWFEVVWYFIVESRL